MSSAPEAFEHRSFQQMELAARIREARRRAGLSQKCLAQRLGVSLWALDEIERGRADAEAHFETLRAAIGLDGVAIESAPPEKAEVERTKTHLAARFREIGQAQSGLHLVLGSVALLILIRFFTEVVHLVPRAANFVDIPIFVVLGATAMTRTLPHGVARRAYMPLAGPILLFLGVCVLATVTNLGRVSLGPMLVFLYGFLAPLGMYAAVYRLWPTGNALAFSRLLIALGVTQLAVVFTINLSQFVSSGHNPDVITGTFGTNAYQLVFFLLIVIALLAGIFTFEPRRAAARFAPALFVMILAAVFLAQYRALLVTTVVSVLIVAALLGPRARGVVAAVLIVASLVITLQYVSNRFPGLKFASTISSLSQSPGFYVSTRFRTAQSVERLYTDTPRFLLTGSGPGTFSSRAWQTFAASGSTSKSNVQSGYAQYLTGSAAYHTDVSDRYVQPELTSGSTVLGSNALTSPYSDYLSLLAEVGVFGFLIIFGIYLRATARVLRQAREALRHPVEGDPRLGLLIATIVAFTALLQMGVLGNWLEVTRLTFVTWTIFAVATKEVAEREKT